MRYTITMKNSHDAGPPHRIAPNGARYAACEPHISSTHAKFYHDRIARHVSFEGHDAGPSCRAIDYDRNGAAMQMPAISTTGRQAIAISMRAAHVDADDADAEEPLAKRGAAPRLTYRRLLARGFCQYSDGASAVEERLRLKDTKCAAMVLFHFAIAMTLDIENFLTPAKESPRCSFISNELLHEAAAAHAMHKQKVASQDDATISDERGSIFAAENASQI